MPPKTAVDLGQAKLTTHNRILLSSRLLTLVRWREDIPTPRVSMVRATARKNSSYKGCHKGTSDMMSTANDEGRVTVTGGQAMVGKDRFDESKRSQTAWKTSGK